MSTEEPQAVVAAAPEESAADSSTGSNSNSSTAEAVAAAAAAAAAAAQLAAASSSPEVTLTGQLFPTLFVVDFSFVKAGNITEVVEISWIVFDVATRQSLEEVSVLVRPELLLAPADLLSSLGGLVLLKEHCVNVEDPPRQTPKPLSAPASNGIPGVGTHIRLRGLPWDVNEDAIIRFVKPVVEIRESDVCVCVGLNKRVTGEAYVNVHTTEMRDLAVRMLHGRMMGARWIEVFRSSAEDFERAQQRRVAMLSSDSRDGRDADVKVLNLTVLKLRGLPWTCTEMNVVNFFQEHGFEIGLDSVVLGVAVDGRMNGIAYVELPDAATADAAKEKLHRKYLGRRFVEVYPSTREEMHRAKRPGRIIPPDVGVGVGAMRMPRPVNARMMGATAQGPYSGGYAPAPQPYGTMATGMGSAQGYGGMDGMGAPQGGYGGYGAPSDIYGGYGGATQQAAYTQSPAQVVQSPPVQDVAPIPVGWNYTVLRLRGMPFNANEQHIVQFFQGFHMTAILPSTIPIDGRPSGEAYVQFSDVSETWRALQAKNGARMDRRYIELFPASKQEMTFAAQGGDPRAFRERDRTF